jgi:AhpD family alkylhydroperoxidase
MAAGTVEQKDKELAYLQVSLGNHSAYCTLAHTATAKRLGLPEAQLEALARAQYDDAFDATEQATLRYAACVTQNPAAIPDSVLEELQRHYRSEQIVELTLAICMANFTNRFNNALGMEPDLG